MYPFLYLKPCFKYKKVCVVCYSGTRVQRLRPCKHRVCMKCIPKLRVHTCPFCREAIQSFLPQDIVNASER